MGQRSDDLGNSLNGRNDLELMTGVLGVSGTWRQTHPFIYSFPPFDEFQDCMMEEYGRRVLALLSGWAGHGGTYVLASISSMRLKDTLSPLTFVAIDMSFREHHGVQCNQDTGSLLLGLVKKTLYNIYSFCLWHWWASRPRPAI